LGDIDKEKPFFSFYIFFWNEFKIRAVSRIRSWFRNVKGLKPEIRGRKRGKDLRSLKISLCI